MMLFMSAVGWLHEGLDGFLSIVRRLCRFVASVYKVLLQRYYAGICKALFEN